MMSHEYMKPSEAAAVLRVNIKTVYKLIHSGELPALQVCGDYRIARSDIARRLAYQPRVSVTVVTPMTARPVAGEFGRRARGVESADVPATGGPV